MEFRCEPPLPGNGENEAESELMGLIGSPNPPRADFCGRSAEQRQAM